MVEANDESFVFISSAIKGNKNIRSELIYYFEELGFSAISYGDKGFGPLSGRPGIEDECLSGVRRSKLFILIIDKRYGNPYYKDADGSDVTLTFLEYLEAMKFKTFIIVCCNYDVWLTWKIWRINKNLDMSFDDEFDEYYHYQFKFLEKVVEDDHNIIKYLDSNHLKNILKKSKSMFIKLVSKPTISEEIEKIGGAI